MADTVKLLLAFVRDCFRSNEELKAEVIVLRHQLNVLQRKSPKKPQLSGTDRALFAWIYRLSTPKTSWANFATEMESRHDPSEFRLQRNARSDVPERVRFSHDIGHAAEVIDAGVQLAAWQNRP